MEQASTAANFSLVPCGSLSACTPGAPIVGVLRWQSPSVLQFVPGVRLSKRSIYGIKLTGGAGAATDVAGNPLNATSGCVAGNISGNTCYRVFKTNNSKLESGVEAAAPAANSTAVGTNTRIVLTFNNPNPGSTEITDMQGGFSMSPNCPSCGSTPYPSARFAWLNGTMTYTPPAALAANTTYSVIEFVDSNTSSSGAGTDYTTSFRTGAGTDSTRPTVLQVLPNPGASGIPISSPINLTFSEPMEPELTMNAFTLLPFTSGCAGGTGTAIAGLGSWSSPTTVLTFDPTSNLTAGQCYKLNLATTAADPAGNTLSSVYSSTFTALSGSAPTVTLTGSIYYPGASVVSSGAGWTTGSGNVVPTWEDGTTLDATGAVVTANAFSAYAFSIPTTASAGAHYIQFTRSSGSTVLQPITVRNPTAVALSASKSDIAAGASTSITASVFDGGLAGNNASVSFSITTDAGSRGSFVAFPTRTTTFTGLTDATGKLAVTLFTSTGGVFANITVTATSAGPTTDSIVILDPPPLPPTALHLSATADGLGISWDASPTTNVRGYRVYVGTAPESYDSDVDVGPVLTYRVPSVQPNATYYAIVRAYNDDGALSDPTPELSVAIPGPTATQLLLSAQGTTLLATVLDQSGKPLSGVGVSFSAPLGVLLAPANGATDAQGTLRSTVSASDPSLANASIRATSAGLSATVDVTFAAVNPTPTATAVMTPTASETLEPTVTATPTATPETSMTPTETLEPSMTPTATPTLEPTMTATPTPSGTATAPPTSTPTATVEALVLITPSVVPSPTSTAVVVPTSSPVPTSTNTALPTTTPTATPTASPTSTKTATPGAGTPTASPTPLTVCGATVTPTATSTATPNPATPTALGTATPTASATATPTTCAPTSTPTATPTPSSTSTSTAVPAATASPTDVSATATPTVVPTAVPTNTPLPAPTSTNTPVPSPTPTPVPTAALPTSTPMPTPSPIPTAPASPPPTATPKPGP